MFNSYEFKVDDSTYTLLINPTPGAGEYAITLLRDTPTTNYQAVFFTIVRLIKEFMEAKPGFTKLLFKATGAGNQHDEQKSRFFTLIGNRVAQQTGKIVLLPVPGQEVAFLKIINVND